VQKFSHGSVMGNPLEKLDTFGLEEIAFSGDTTSVKDHSNDKRLLGTAVLSDLVHLLKTYVDDITELRRTRRQLRKIKEVSVEGIGTRRRRIDCAATLEHAGRIL
jgi:hypothetical protein